MIAPPPDVPAPPPPQAPQAQLALRPLPPVPPPPREALALPAPPADRVEVRNLPLIGEREVFVPGVRTEAEPFIEKTAPALDLGFITDMGEASAEVMRVSLNTIDEAIKSLNLFPEDEQPINLPQTIRNFPRPGVGADYGLDYALRGMAKLATFLVSQGENEVIEKIPEVDENYARLVKEVYKGSKTDFGIYKYKKSLTFEDTLQQTRDRVGLATLVGGNLHFILENLLGLPTEAVARFPVGGQGGITPEDVRRMMDDPTEDLQAYQADFRIVGANYFRDNPAIRELLQDRVEMEGLGIPERVRAIDPLSARDDGFRLDTPFGRPDPGNFDFYFNFIQRLPFIRYSAQALRLNQVNTYDRDFINGLRDEIIRGEARVGDFVLPSVGRNDILNYVEAIQGRITRMLNDYLPQRPDAIDVRQPAREDYAGRQTPQPILALDPTRNLDPAPPMPPQLTQNLIELIERVEQLLGEEEYSMDVIFRRGSIRTPVLGIVALVEYFIFTNMRAMGIERGRVMHPEQMAYDSFYKNFVDKDYERPMPTPKINYYVDGDRDIFVIRGTKGLDDVIEDFMVGGQFLTAKTVDILSKPFTNKGIYEPEMGNAIAQRKKMRTIERFIRQNARDLSKTTVVGHSLGTIEANILKVRMPEIEAVGFSPGIIPAPDVDRAYSINIDPLYYQTGLANHKVIKKVFDINQGGRLEQGHSIDNFIS